MQRSVLRLPQEHQLKMAMPTEQDQVVLTDFPDYERMALDYALLNVAPDAPRRSFCASRSARAWPQAGTCRRSRDIRRWRSPGSSSAGSGGSRGIVFLLLGDEFGMVNVLVSRGLAAQERDVVQLAQFVVARGELEVRAGEQRTLVATSLRELLPADALAMPKGKNWG